MAGSCTKVNATLFPSGTDVSSPPYELHLWRQDWAPSGTYGRSQYSTSIMVNVDTHFTLSWAMFNPIESGCKKKLVATSWAVVVLEDKMVNCEMPRKTWNNQTMDLAAHAKNGSPGRTRFFRDWEPAASHSTKSTRACSKDLCPAEAQSLVERSAQWRHRAML